MSKKVEIHSARIGFRILVRELRSRERERHELRHLLGEVLATMAVNLQEGRPFASGMSDSQLMSANLMLQRFRNQADAIYKDTNHE